MGLDQYAYTRNENTKPSEAEPKFIWRKHAKLQEWMEQLFLEKTGQTSEKLNCGELELNSADIEDLEALVNDRALPESPGGFFFGHQFQDEAAEDNRSQDLGFCAWALSEFNKGNRVYYSCWW